MKIAYRGLGVYSLGLAQLLWLEVSCAWHDDHVGHPLPPCHTVMYEACLH